MTMQWPQIPPWVRRSLAKDGQAPLLLARGVSLYTQYRVVTLAGAVSLTAPAVRADPKRLLLSLSSAYGSSAPWSLSAGDIAVGGGVWSPGTGGALIYTRQEHGYWCVAEWYTSGAIAVAAAPPAAAALTILEILEM